MTDEMGWLLLRQVGGLLVCFLVLMPVFAHLILKPLSTGLYRSRLKKRYLTAFGPETITIERMDELAESYAERKWRNYWVNPL